MNPDKVLAQLIDTVDPSSRTALIAEVIASSAPFVERALQRTCAGWLRDDEVADVRSTVYVRLLNRLRNVVPGSEAIENVEGFVVTVTTNTANDFLRQRYPQRTRLKNRIRYLLTHDERLSLWNSSGRLVAGLSTQQDQAVTRVSLTSTQFDEIATDASDGRRALEAIFERIGSPLYLDDLLRLAEVLWNIRDIHHESGTDLPSSAPSAAEQLEQRSELESLWREVLLLPVSQRAALLLNLRDGDGGNALALIILLGISSFDDVALAVGLEPERLAALWETLPMPDSAIAQSLELTRQQIINLRKAARGRLHRRMATLHR